MASGSGAPPRAGSPLLPAPGAASDAAQTQPQAATEEPQVEEKAEPEQPQVEEKAEVRSRGLPATATSDESQPQPPEEEAEQPRPWVLLAAVPRLHDEAAHLTRDLSFGLAPPPRVSVFRAAPRITTRSPKRPLLDNSLGEPSSSAGHRSRFYYPYLASVDPSGALLLCACHRSDWNESPGHNSPRFFIGDAITGMASELPDTDCALHVLEHPGSIGLICNTDGRLMVADLKPSRVSNEVVLLRHWVGTDGWSVKNLPCTWSNSGRPWGNNGVVALGGRLWWVDLAHGILTCDPFLEDPNFTYIPLPSGCALPEDTTHEVLRGIDKFRCVRVSRGRIRYVQIHEHSGVPTVTMWTATLTADNGQWACNYRVPIRDIMDHPSYSKCDAADSPLPRRVPAIALVDPFDPDIVYFWQGELIFAVNVPKREVAKAGARFITSKYKIPEGEFHSSRSVHAWKLPAALHHHLHGSGGCFSFVSAILQSVLFCAPDIEEESDDGTSVYLSSPEGSSDES